MLFFKCLNVKRAILELFGGVRIPNQHPFASFSSSLLFIGVC